MCECVSCIHWHRFIHMRRARTQTPIRQHTHSSASDVVWVYRCRCYCRNCYCCCRWVWPVCVCMCCYVVHVMSHSLSLTAPEPHDTVQLTSVIHRAEVALLLDTNYSVLTNFRSVDDDIHTEINKIQSYRSNVDTKQVAVELLWWWCWCCWPHNITQQNTVCFISLEFRFICCCFLVRSFSFECFRLCVVVFYLIFLFHLFGVCSGGVFCATHSTLGLIVPKNP